MVVAHNAIVYVDLLRAMDKTFKPVGMLTLHLGLDYIDWIVADGRAETCEDASREIDQDLTV
jgi:hypothetical protein